MTFPTLEEWTAPWEKDGIEIDPAKAKAFAYSFKKAAHELETKAKADKTELEDALEVYRKAEAAAARENETETQRLVRENQELSEKLNKASNPRQQLILEVALEKGLTKKQALRLVGDTQEELEADADEYLKDLGVKTTKAEDEVPPGDEDEEDVDKGITLHRRPSQARTPGDPKPNEAPDLDVAKAIAAMPRL